jgi:hypothetical protein
MDEAVVGTERAKPLLAHRFTVNKAGGIRLAERDMTGGVLVKEGVPEKNARLSDRRVVRDEGNLAETTGTVVSRDKLVEGFFASSGRGFGNASVLKRTLNVFD